MKIIKSKEPEPLKIGDVVRLNATGVMQCFNTNPEWEDFYSNIHMRITYISKESLTYPETTYEVRVDNAHINSLMIDNRCFTKVI